MFRLAAIVAAVLAPTMAWAYVTDTASHAPPTSGAYAYYSTYGAFGPDRPGFVARGQTFVDPVFGSTIRRLTNEVGQVSQSDIYAKNGFYNADGTRMLHRGPTDRTIIDTTTGAVVRGDVPGNFDGSFAPDDPDTWYYFSGSSLRKLSLDTGGTSLVKTFSGTLGFLGGSTDWIDNSGRYMVLNIGGSIRVWDKQSDVLYAGALSGDVGAGWAGISPDGKYLVAAGDDKRSYAINHATRTVNTTGVMFWSLCGDHGDLVSATNGKTYFVTFECHSDPGVWAVDITIPQTAANDTKQRADNTKLFGLAWIDEGHISAVSRGLLKDWAYVSVESNDDSFTGGVSGWRPYKQEIVMANVLTGEVRRLAHHRSRGIGGSYYYQPRVSASWDGARVAWASNFGLDGADYGDIYSILVDAGGAPPDPLTAAFTAPAANASVSGTTTISVVAAGGTGYTYRFLVDDITVSSGASASFAWSTSTVSNGSHMLNVQVTDALGRTATIGRRVTVSNAALAIAFTSPGLVGSPPTAVVSGTTAQVKTTVTGVPAGALTTVEIAVDGAVMMAQTHTGALTTLFWNTTRETNGAHVLKATVTDALGRKATASRTVTVANLNTGGVVASFTSPAASSTVSGIVTIRMAMAQGVGGACGMNTYQLAVDGVVVATQVLEGIIAVYPWDSRTVANGNRTLRLTVTDATGSTHSVTRVLRVSN